MSAEPTTLEEPRVGDGRPDPQWALAGDLLARAAREFRLCSSCGLCKRICAVFPAAEPRGSLTSGDVAYLANLCHDCRACFAICPFKAKSRHGRGIDIPALLSEVRGQTYERFARPRQLWRLLTGPRPVWSAAVVTLLFFALVAAATGDPARIVDRHPEAGSFYHVIGYLWLVVPASAVAAYLFVVLSVGVADFWRATGGGGRGFLSGRAHARALVDVLGLRNLRGGGRGCAYAGDAVSSIRRRLHFCVFYGFLATLLATVAAAFEQELLGVDPPYPLVSVPVISGAAGGLAILAGCAGFLVLGTRARERRKSDQARRLDRSFTVALAAATLTGLLTLALRSTPAMGAMLILHLGVLGGLYMTFPYGKLVHAAYRYAALVRFHVESEAPGRQEAPTVARPVGRRNAFG
jgi:citrate/tricarballylate utilization protein